MIPAVNRVTPKLSSGAEIIGRNSGHLRGFAIAIEFEQIGIRPYVSAVMRHVNWNVAHHPNSVRLTITLQLGPLAIELPLPEFLKLNLLRVRFGIAPFGPGYLAIGLFERHEAGKIVEPGALPLAELLELRRWTKIGESLPQ